MIQKVEPLSSTDFDKGLVTRSDILKSDPNQSPNTMDVKWNFDGSIQKRLGSSTANSVIISSTPAGGGTFIVQNSLTNNLVAYWKMDEASGNRNDSFGSLNLIESPAGILPSITGIRNNAVDFNTPYQVNSSAALYVNANSSFSFNTNEDLSIACWVYFVNTAGAHQFINHGTSITGAKNYELLLQNSGGTKKFLFRIRNSSNVSTSVFSNSFGQAQQETWYSVVGWCSNSTHIGVSVNLSVDTALIATGSNMYAATNGQVIVGVRDTGSLTDLLGGRIDELGLWRRVLTSEERASLYAGGSGNTYTENSNYNSWASLDFGASSIRWLTISAGTGILASSNGGTTFVSIATSRTETYQYLDRSRNVLIATSDAYDVPLYWAGSAGTFASILAINSAPSVKYSINYQGFLILLNSSARKRGFFYADENTQLSDPWTDSFDIPSSYDDEITAGFILGTYLYVSTRYRIYRVSYVGGNPDWKYLKVKDWGFVPRTVKLATLKKETTQVAIGLDWNRRIRVFDGYNDLIISDNIENDNNICNFATSKISFQGSGLIASYAEIDSNEQEYRLGLSIGQGSTQVTHHIVLNLRTLAFYPYSNQVYNTMVMAESNNILRLMAFDRSGYCHILNSGNLDGNTTAVNEVYDSPLLYKNTPGNVSKSKEVNLYFSVTSSGTIYSRERADMSNVWSEMKPLRDSKGVSEFLSSESSLQLQRSVDITSVQNTFQFQITSSANTANPWKMTHYDYLQSGLGFGKGG